MPQSIELATFLTEGITRLKDTASLAPSSDSLIEKMVEPLPLHRARCVVEFGVGTGGITAELLTRMRPDAVLLGFEINERLASFARDRLADRRLELLSTGAENLGEELRSRGIQGADAIVSSLGLTFMDDGLRHRIYDEAARALAPGGVLTQYVYIHGKVVAFRKFDGEFRRFPAEEFFSDRFGRVERRRVWKNFPPAFVYSCAFSSGLEGRTLREGLRAPA